jgi:hypothetical protein
MFTQFIGTIATVYGVFGARNTTAISPWPAAPDPQP